MLQLCVFLLIVGVLAILLEILMPGFDGFISGLIGILALVASAILAVLFVPGGWFLVGINLAVLGVSTLVLFSYIRSKQLQGKIILSDALAEDLPTIDYAGLVGKEGKTVTLLRPYGEADFNGIRVEVSSNGTMIERGSRVRVTETQANKVIVSLIDGN
jgi:membrane-bound serine protease (ClpP class)